MAALSNWLVSFRLRTLPLALSTILLGSFLAIYHRQFQWKVFVLAIVTTLFLQILSNLANDYGDSRHGVDNHERVGPHRSLQSGAISLEQMKRAIILFIVLSFLSGIYLIYEGTKGLEQSYLYLFLLLGIAAIVAALKYTIGKRPYGYAGLGDLFVFLFFGIVGVLGSYFLHTHRLGLAEVLPAVSIGCFSAGVLNLNNLRDRKNDLAHGKRTLIVKIGFERGKVYHILLLLAGMGAAFAYAVLNRFSLSQWVFLLSFVGVLRNLVVVAKSDEATRFDPELRNLSLSTLGFSLLFGIGLML